MTVLLGEQIRARAYDLGFDLVGIAPAQPSPHAREFIAWLEAGHAGEMAYMAREPERRQDPRQVLPGARSIISVGLSYYARRLPEDIVRDPSRGIISNYAWGQDYHKVMTPRLRALADFIRVEAGGAVATRVYVDTGPLLERDIAVQTGLGFTGKNTCLIHPRLGSYLFLGEILTDLDLQPDTTLSAGIGCGRCIRCLVACPTDAFVAPFVLDSRRCISYLTIELRGPIPKELRPLLGNRIFGCDICQEVCPWNLHFARPGREPAFYPVDLDRAAPPLLDLIELTEEGFHARFGDTPVKRAGRRGLLRNVAVALGNWGDPQALPALTRALHDPEPLIRAHAAWALGRMADRRAQEALAQAASTETDATVIEEIQGALSPYP